jgi:mannose-6-phosphate isomerase
MPKLDCPLQLSPVIKPKIWGRKNLSPIYDGLPRLGARSTLGASQAAVAESREQLIGEVWLTDDTARFLNGPVAGLTLAEVSRKYGPELHGRNWHDPRFPLLAKYIFTNDWLSVQVHPDDDYARTHDPGNFGKCEMWYIVHADRNAQLLLGLKAGVRKEDLGAAFQKGTCKALLNRFHPKAGEAIFIPPGTVHALGPGLVLFEAEENSDLTYRLDDFGRLGLDGQPRPLHLHKGLEVIRMDLPAYRDLPRREFREPYGSRRYVLASRFFAVEELKMQKQASFQGSQERVEVLSMLAGDGRMETTAGWFAYRTGDTWVVPPTAEQFRLVPRKNTRLLKYYVPDLDKDFRRPLLARRLRPATIERIVFD